MIFDAYGIKIPIDKNEERCSWAAPTSWELFGFNEYKKEWISINKNESSSLFSDRNIFQWFSIPEKVEYSSIKFVSYSQDIPLNNRLGLERFELRGFLKSQIIKR